MEQSDICLFRQEYLASNSNVAAIVYICTASLQSTRAMVAFTRARLLFLALVLERHLAEYLFLAAPQLILN